MKKVLLVLGLMLSVTFTYAQRLNLYGAYAFDDKVSSSYSSSEYFDGKIKGGFQGGAGVEFNPMPDYGVELLYLRQDTHAPIRYSTGITSATDTNFTLKLNYLLLAAGRSVTLPSNENIQGFANLMLGADFMNTKNPDSGVERSATKFAWGARIGLNIFASENIGVKLYALMLSNVQGAGGGLYFGTGGVGAGVSTYSTMYQFAVGGGLIFKK